jgi:hypothetical protein
MGWYRLARRLTYASGVTESFVGVQRGSDRPVLLKRLAGPWANRAVGERLATMAPRLRSAGLVVPLELGLAAETPWLVYELVDGEPLRQVMNALGRASGFIAPNEGLALVARTAALLETAHAQGVPHGDLSASTILLGPDGSVQLLEAGVAAAAGALPDGGPARTEASALAPEQLAAPATPSTDVFRLGLILFELSMGRPMWGALSPGQAAQQVASWGGLARDRVKQVPEPWQTLLLSMLSVDPTERPAMGEVAAVLEQGLSQSGWDASPGALARLFTRATEGRVPLTAGLGAGGQELHLVALGHQGGNAPVVTPPGAVVARIATRKMTFEELQAVKEPRPSPSSPSSAAPLLPTSADDRDGRAGELLLERGRVTRPQLLSAHDYVRRQGGSLVAALEALGFIDEDTAVAAVAELTRSPTMTAERLARALPEPEALSLISADLARKHDVVPLALKGGTQLVVAMREPLDTAALEALKAAIAPRSLVALRAGARALAAARERFYGVAVGALETGAAAPGDFERHTASQWTPAADAPTTSSSSATRRAELSARLLDTLLAMQGQRGAQAQQLVSLAASLALRGGATAREEARVRLAAQALCVAALSAGRAPFAVPTLTEFQDTVGFGTHVEPLVQQVLDWPEALPSAADARGLVLAFAFAQHAGEPRPAPRRSGAAVQAFRARFKLDEEVVAGLFAELGA